MIYYTKYDSKIGKLTIVSDGKNLIGLYIENQKYYMDNIKGKITLKNDLPIFIKVKKWLDSYFNGEKVDIEDIKPYLNPSGSEFRKNVWELLCEIPYGTTVTYGDIAKKVAKQENKEKMSAQAIGGAISHNPISIIIPCHRVIGRNGSLTGYAGGINIKKELLELEGISFDNI